MPTEGSPPQLSAIFAEIEQALLPDSTPVGIVRRRIQSHSSCDLLIGVQKPANVRVLIVRFSNDAVPIPYELPDFRSLELQVQHEMEGTAERLSITLRAPQSAWNDIFTSLTEDITRAVGSQTEEKAAAKVFQRRLLQWQTLLQKTGVAGLTEEQQQGLYGELWCLREVVIPAMPASSALMAWTGPGGTDRDFQFVGAIALEIKTTRSSNSPMLTISSERQLDDTGLNALYVLHIALEKKLGAGETLPQIVMALRSLFSFDPLLSSLLEDKLLNVGYLEAQSERYKTAGYSHHGLKFYHVQEGFPRITPQNLLPGVGNVRYAISSSSCMPFAVDVPFFIAQIKES